MEKDLTCPFQKLTTQHLEVNLIFISRIQSKRTKCNFILNFKGKEIINPQRKGTAVYANQEWCFQLHFHI